MWEVEGNSSPPKANSHCLAERMAPAEHFFVKMNAGAKHLSKVGAASPLAPISMLKGQLVLTRLAVGSSRAKFNIEFGERGLERVSVKT